MASPGQRLRELILAPGMGLPQLREIEGRCLSAAAGRERKYGDRA